jgi:hypothetical protein
VLTEYWSYVRSSLAGALVGAVTFIITAPFTAVDHFEQRKVLALAIASGIALACAVVYCVNRRVGRVRR